MDKGTGVDQAFAGISRTSSAFLIWRVENLQLVPVPKDQYGTFYEGDSYIVYVATEHGCHPSFEEKSKEIRGKMEVHIHFWLGKETSQDERAVAAFKTVELDNYLGGAPVQHREVMGSESERFRSYFKSKIRILKGGIGSGLTCVNNNFEPRLFKIKGRRSPLVTQMPGVSWEFFNSGDVFIIDTKDVIFVWIGKKSNTQERLQAAKVSVQLKAQHHALSIVFIDEGKESELQEAEKMLLGVFLDLNPQAKSRRFAEIIENDQEYENESKKTLRLYRCSDYDGTYKVTEIKTGPLKQSDLNSQDSFIIDNCPNHIWVWVGKEASPKERYEALRNALGYMKKKNYPETTKLSRVVDGGEPMEFKALFPCWKEKETTNLNVKLRNGFNNKPILTNLASDDLHKNPSVAAQEQLIDDGSGSCEVWLCHKSELIPLPVSSYGIFYSEGCYVVKYSYKTTNGPRPILYYWVGENSMSGEQPLTALLRAFEESSSKIMPIQVRVTQGKEPPNFLAIFKGKFIIMNGEHLGNLPQIFMLQVQGNYSHNTRAIQVEYNSSSLDSSDVFVIKSYKNGYVWCGRSSTGDEREIAKKVAYEVLGPDYELYFEGQEKNDFWDNIGGNYGYKRGKRREEIKNSKEIRLFQCSNSSGKFRADEIVHFTQSDLLPEDVMLLDAVHSIFIWIGEKSNKEEKKKSIQFATEYLQTDSSGREINIPIFQMHQSFEPPHFTGLFKLWDPAMWTSQKSFEQIRKELNEQKPKLQVELKDVNGSKDFLQCKKFPIDVLLERDPTKLPPGVSLTHKEMHLKEEDFNKLFGMNHSVFSSLPKWKQENLKKRVGLF